MADDFLHLGVQPINEGLAYGMGDGSDLTGSDMKDLTGNARSGTITGTTVISNGFWSKARTFNGSSDEISAGDVLDMGTGDFAVSVAVKTSTTTLGYLVSKRDAGTSTNDGWAIRINADGTVSSEHCDGSADVIVATSTGTVNDGSWHHIAVNWDRDASMTIYIDNAADGSASISAQSADNANAVNLYVGRQANGTTPDYLAADIDEVYIFTRTLTTGRGEIFAISNAPRTRLTSPDGTTRMALLDSRTTMDLTRTIIETPITKLGTTDAGQNNDIDLKQIRRVFSVVGKGVPFGYHQATEVMAEIETLVNTYQDSTGQARMRFDWGYKDRNGNWKTYQVQGVKLTGVKDNDADGGADRVFNYQMNFTEGGILSTSG